ncbi:MAG: O-linked N-acetylglucosamine transferase, SPINDLY family protein, partial [Elainellaceae cyanobacterium]
MTSQSTDLLDQATAAYHSQNYNHAASIFEKLLEHHPSEKSYCWQLGLMRLLERQESEAQLIWMLGMADAEPQDMQQWMLDLTHLLNAEANKQAQAGSYEMAWLIRHHLNQIDAANIDNLLLIIQLSVALKQFTEDDLETLEVVERLQESEGSDINPELLLQTFKVIPPEQYRLTWVFKLVQAAAKVAPDRSAFIKILIKKAIFIGYVLNNLTDSLPYLELCFELDPSNLITIHHLTDYYLKMRKYDDAIKLAEKHCDLAETIYQKVRGNALLLKALMTAGGNWQLATGAYERTKHLLKEFVDRYQYSIEEPLGTSFLGISTFFFPYLKDDPFEHRLLQNQIAQIYQQDLRSFIKDSVLQYQQSDGHLFSHSRQTQGKTKLKIGYVSMFLRKHSVGWLSRWLFQHHNHDEFDVYAYFVQQAEATDFTRQWFAKKASSASCFTGDYLGISEAIHDDQIDILVDLDSLTSDCTSAIMALKPAPVQVTWLGLDATGIPAIDYFIVDPYVLPENAQEWYAETIWKLPNTYIAVDGFEVGIPTLRRDLLDIPSDAIIYFSAQSGFKRHPDHVRLQLKILQAVPNSYFLIKGVGDENSIRTMFGKLAEEEGVSPDRLRFLPRDSDELTHRANMQIADVVLDTFPYNGATTTLETLWLGIPLVTRVGQQFAARNSYTMMMNAGITEGIA